jgi:hypothetical protein
MIMTGPEIVEAASRWALLRWWRNEEGVLCVIRVKVTDR